MNNKVPVLHGLKYNRIGVRTLIKVQIKAAELVIQIQSIIALLQRLKSV